MEPTLRDGGPPSPLSPRAAAALVGAYKSTAHTSAIHLVAATALLRRRLARRRLRRPLLACALLACVRKESLSRWPARLPARLPIWKSAGGDGAHRGHKSARPQQPRPAAGAIPRAKVASWPSWRLHCSATTTAGQRRHHVDKPPPPPPPLLQQRHNHCLCRRRRRRPVACMTQSLCAPKMSLPRQQVADRPAGKGGFLLKGVSFNVAAAAA